MVADLHEMTSGINSPWSNAEAMEPQHIVREISQVRAEVEVEVFVLLSTISIRMNPLPRHRVLLRPTILSSLWSRF